MHGLQIRANGEVLIGRNVTLFPDAGCFNKWSAKAKELSSITTFKVSNVLEDKNEIKEGSDLADYLLITNKTA